MRLKFIKLVIGFVLIILSEPVSAQFSTLKYVSYGYFDGLKFDSAELKSESFVITITERNVKILKVDLSDPGKDSLYLERRCLSALKYPTLDGDEYYVWKLGDRKMVLRKENNIKYLSLYQTDDYGLPREYITFLISE